ncbi:GNAT family N-acetyltransferase [Chryseobacterium daecheongense]|nr:GNAT family N-acetyltransferase [Chryseobacterium daecheongense]
MRNAVKENRLSNPDLVTDKDCEEFLFERGKVWVCEINDQVVGFSIVDLKENNIWALFVHPDFEGRNRAKASPQSCWIGIFSKLKKVFGWEQLLIQELKSFTGR